MVIGHPLPDRCQGQRNHLNVPQEQRGWWLPPVACPHWDLMSWGGFWSILSSDVWLYQLSGSPASTLLCLSDSLGGTGAIIPAGISVSISSSLSSLMMMSESCWVRLSSTMETSLAFPSFSAGGGMCGLGLLSVTEPSHFCSSSQTCSSHNMEEECLISIASLKAIWWALVSGLSASFTTLSHKGQGGVGNFRPHGLDGSWGDLSHGSWDPPLLILQLCCSLVSCLLLDSLWDLPPCFSISDPCSSHPWVLLSGPWEGVQWSPTAIWVWLCSSCVCLLFSYWDWLSIPSKKGAQRNAICSWTP